MNKDILGASVVSVCALHWHHIYVHVTDISGRAYWWMKRRCLSIRSGVWLFWKCHTGWQRPIGCLILEVISRKRATNYRAKKPLIIGLFCGKWPVKTRHPVGLRHPVSHLSQQWHFIIVGTSLGGHIMNKETLFEHHMSRMILFEVSRSQHPQIGISSVWETSLGGT